jgi:deoxyribonuclease-4
MSKAERLLIGAHMSISGGVELAPLRGRDVGCACIQIFTKSNMQWAARPLAEKEIAAFKLNCARTGIAPVVAHNSYLINLGAPDAALAKKSFDSFLMELERCRALGLPAIIAHPGSHTGAGEAEGLRRIGNAVNELIERTSGSPVRLLLETTAGQGSNLGYRFEQLAEIMEGVREKSRVGVCLDTCHVFAAGYDIRTEDGYRRTMEEFDKVVGLKKLQAFHLNDAKGELGSKLDRHEQIGYGRLGKEPFRLLLRDERFAAIPKVLETPKGMKGKLEWDVINLRLLRQLGGEDA